LTTKLQAPFPYFGGKAMISNDIWQLLGNPQHFLEPFAGSLAVLLARPNGMNLPLSFAETVNDKDCIISNVWRALKYDPEQTCKYADDIVSHVDLMAKKKYINDNQPELLAKMSNDAEYYDCKIAGYYIWAASCWIGAGLTHPTQIPHLTDNGNGINKTQIPHLGDNGKGINKTKRPYLADWFESLSQRLRRVRIVNGDWMQILGGEWQGDKWNSVGIYLDPPYSNLANRDKNIYAEDSLDIAHEVRNYCIKITQKHPDWKIILSGYYEEHLELLDYGFDFIGWKTTGGYGNTATIDKSIKTQGQKNRKKECLFFSESCKNDKLFK